MVYSNRKDDSLLRNYRDFFRAVYANIEKVWAYKVTYLSLSSRNRSSLFINFTREKTLKKELTNTI